MLEAWTGVDGPVLDPGYAVYQTHVAAFRRPQAESFFALGPDGRGGRAQPDSTSSLASRLRNPGAMRDRARITFASGVITATGLLTPMASMISLATRSGVKLRRS